MSRLGNIPLNPKQDSDYKGLDDFTSPKMTSEQKLAIEQDPATTLAKGSGQYIEIYHIPSGQAIKFKAYIEQFQDQYKCDWTPTNVYGRMDPINQYGGTTRVITLDWVVPAVSYAEAVLNHEKLSLLFSMLYPHYEDVGPTAASSATQISTAPVFRLKFGNLIQDPTVTKGSGGGTAEETGLVGAIDGFIYAPDLEAGFIDGAEPSGNPLRDILPQNGSYGRLYPKASKLS